PETAADLGTLDAGAIARVRGEAWPQVESADELHDALLQLGFLTAAEGRTGAPAWNQGEGESGWESFLNELSADRRAAVLHTDGPALWVAAERLPELMALFPDASTTPAIAAPENFAAKQWTFEEALVEVLRGRMEAIGPVTVADLAASLGLPES